MTDIRERYDFGDFSHRDAELFQLAYSNGWFDGRRDLVEIAKISAERTYPGSYLEATMNHVMACTKGKFATPRPPSDDAAETDQV